MLGLDEVRNLLARFQEADNNGELDDEGTGAYKALQWVTGDADYTEMDDMLPDEEVCEDCGSPDCPGAAGGECEDNEEVEVVEPNPEDFQIDLKMQRES